MVTVLKRSLRIFKRDNYTCRYCDFNGRAFEGWLFLSIDHVDIARKAGGRKNDDDSNLATAYVSCNYLSSRMTVHTVAEKRKLIQERRKEHWNFWESNVK